MGWTVIIEDENGKEKKTMSGEFILSDVSNFGPTKQVLLLCNTRTS